MNKIIKQQLDKCKVSLPEYNEDTIKIIIPKDLSEQSNKEIQLKLDYYYVIKLARYILYPPDNFTLDSNWNKGIRAKSEYMLGTPVKFIGKMTQWDCCGYDIESSKVKDDVYNGIWFPNGGITIIEEVWSK